MDRESPLVTELSPDDPSFPLLSQHSPSASRRSKAALAAATPASQQPGSSSHKAASGISPKQQPGGAESSDEPPMGAPGASRRGNQPAQASLRERLEPLESNDDLQPDIRLPSAAATASEEASTGSGEASLICACLKLAIKPETDAKSSGIILSKAHPLALPS